MDKNIRATLIVLFAHDRNTPYANKKYHSGIICTGVTKGFAKIKFSSSLSMFGQILYTNKIKKKQKNQLNISFTIYKGKKDFQLLFDIYLLLPHM